MVKESSGNIGSTASMFINYDWDNLDLSSCGVKLHKWMSADQPSTPHPS
jgi:hypothetical protein